MSGQNVMAVSREIQGRLRGRREQLGIRNKELGDYLAIQWDIVPSSSKVWITGLETGGFIIRLGNETDPAVRKGSTDYKKTQNRIIDYLAALDVSDRKVIEEILDGILVISPSFDFSYRSLVKPYEKDN
jgi:hypothetical protein